jgi:micrococcal nuclease
MTCDNSSACYPPRMTRLALLLVLLLPFPALAVPVLRVVDGDTLVVGIDGERVKVRMIGTDTPETKHPKKPVQYFGREASAFTKRLLLGKDVRLEYGQRRTDRYGRVLAYVWLGDMLVNEEIIRQGYGFAYTRFPHARLEEFRAAEREARLAGRGLWAKR